MRKENSDFITKFITSEGDRKINRDYFAYVELDDYACWILADGLDTDEDKASAEIVASSIIEDFTEKPKMEIKALKKYLKTGNGVLLKERRMNLLKVSIVVIVSDYKSIIYGSVGNTRLYHFRKNQLHYRTKDHSIAELMVKLGKIDKNSVNQNIERNNLTDYLGKKKGLKISMVKKPIELKEGDILLLLTLGYWENMKDREIEDIIKASEDIDGLVTNLENVMLENDNPGLNNYSIAGISIKKVFIQNIKKKMINKRNILIASLALILVVGGVYLYNHHQNNLKLEKNQIQSLKIARLKEEKIKLKKIKEQKIKLSKIKEQKIKLKKIKEQKAKLAELKKMELAKLKKTELSKFENSMNLEKEGDAIFLKKDYVGAKDNYNKALVTYKLLDKKDEQKNIKSKVEKIEKIEKSNKFILIAKDYDSSGDYINAKINYMKAKDLIEGIEELDEQKIDKQIFNIESKSKARDLEKVGDIYFSNENYDKSIENYGLAKDNYSKVEGYDLKETSLKLEKSKILNKAKNSEELGNELYGNQKYIKAISKYELALENYKNAKVIEKEIKLTNKIDKSKNILSAISLEGEGDQLKVGDDLLGAKAKYEEAKLAYQEVGLSLKEKDSNDKLIVVNLELLRLSKIKDAEVDELDGDSSLGAKSFDEAKEKYEKAKKVYQEVQLFDKSNKIDLKLKRVEMDREYFDAKTYEGLADAFFKQKKYDDALANYEIAKNSYLTLEKTKEYMETEKKIKDTKKKNKKILGIF